MKMAKLTTGVVKFDVGILPGIKLSINVLPKPKATLTWDGIPAENPKGKGKKKED